MSVYTMADKPVFRVEQTIAAGTKFVYDWNLTHVSNGVYFARIKLSYFDGGEDKKTVKIAVLK